MLDIRTHFVYLCVIFLMLGFGILIGASLVGQKQVQQQATSIAALRRQVDGAVQDGQQAKDALTKNEAVLDALRPTIVHGKLAGKRVVVIQTGDDLDAKEKATEALTGAGATVTTVTVADEWITQLPKQRDALSTELGVSPLAALASVLTQNGDAARNAAMQQTLTDHQLITVTGDLTQPTTLFVLVSGDEGVAGGVARAEQMDAPLIAQLLSDTQGGARIVGCEPSDVLESIMPTYQTAGIATIDCIDKPLGQLDLPFALRGEKDDYGLKPTAQRQYPASLEEQITDDQPDPPHLRLTPSLQ